MIRKQCELKGFINELASLETEGKERLSAKEYNFFREELLWRVQNNRNANLMTAKQFRIFVDIFKRA